MQIAQLPPKSSTGPRLPDGIRIYAISDIHGCAHLLEQMFRVIDADVANLGIAAVQFRDRFWPKSVLSFLFLAAVLTVASVQFVTPTRRWRPSLPGPVRRLVRRRSAP